MKLFKHSELNLSKIGRVSSHLTKSANKTYQKAKLYLKNPSLVGKGYELYVLGEIGIEEVANAIVKGQGLLIFFPNVKRPKERIGTFEEHRLTNRYLSGMNSHA